MTSQQDNPKVLFIPRGKVLEDKIQDKYRAHYHDESPKYDHSGQGHMDIGQPQRTTPEDIHRGGTRPEDNQKGQAPNDISKGQSKRTTGTGRQS